jgi:Subtilase family
MFRRFFALAVLCTAAMPLFAGNGKITRVPKRVPGLYMVILDERMTSRPQVPEVANRLTREHGAQLRLVMNNAASIFSIQATEQQAAALAHHPFVLNVEEVGEVHLSTVQSVPSTLTYGGRSLWNLDRIDQWGTADSGFYQYCERGRDVHAYVVDLGVRGTHHEFRRPDGTSRVKRGACFAEDCVENRGDTVCPLTPNDTGLLTMFNHGTSVASILGGNNVGVAKDVTIVPLRFYTCTTGNQETPVATTERFCWALDWIRSANNPDRNARPAVVSLSAYTRANDTLLASFEHVINGLVNNDLASGWTGIPVIVSANNQGMSTCVTSPARMAYRNNTTVASPGFASTGRVISVGGSSRAMVNGVLRDVRWQTPMFQGDPNAHTEYCFDAQGNVTPVNAGSNHGNMVDIYAPADNVAAADATSDTAYRTGQNSGTSFAAPLVAGIAARILQVEPNLTPAQVWTRIQQYAQTVAVPFDTTGVNQWGQPTSNSLLAIRRYTSATCSVEYP